MKGSPVFRETLAVGFEEINFPAGLLRGLLAGKLDFTGGFEEARSVAGHKTVWEVLGLVVVASMLRFIGLDDPLWLDEAASILFAWQGYGGVVDALAVDSTPPLFYWMLTGWIGVFGDSELALRALPATGGVLSVVATWFAARRLFPDQRWVPGVAGLLIAVSPLAVYYGRECRMYAFCPLIGALAISTLYGALNQNTWRRWLAYTSVLAVGLYTHNFVIFLLPLAPVAALLVAEPGVRARTFVWSLGASVFAVVAFAPWLPILVDQASSGVTAWIPAVWEGTPPSMALIHSLEAMGVGGVYPEYLRGLGSLDMGIIARGVGLVLLLALLPWRWIRVRSHRRSLVLAVLLLLLTTVVPWIVSFVVKPIYVVGRYELLAMPGLALLMAAGVQSLPHKIGTAGLVLWLALAAGTIVVVTAAPSNTYERDLANRIHGQAEAEDVIVFTDYTRAVPEYYLKRWDSQATRRSFPPGQEAHPGWYDVEAALQNPAKTYGEADAMARELAVVLRGGHRVFVVNHTADARIQVVNTVLYRKLCEHMGPQHPSCLHRSGAGLGFVVYGPPAE